MCIRDRSYTGRLYDHPTKLSARFLPEAVSFRSILEVSFLLNLAVVGVSILYVNDNAETKAAVVYTSVGIVFLQFLGIVLYHLWCAVKKKVCKSSDSSTTNLRGGYQPLEGEHDTTATPPTTTSISLGAAKGTSNSHDQEHQSSYKSAQYREPMLTEFTA